MIRRLPCRFANWLAMTVVLFSCVMPAFAADGRVTYSQNAGRFVFEPGSQYSPTDLFPNFKDVIPGDSIQQTITVRNDPANGCKARIYLRALGAHPDSAEFLSQLELTVTKDSDTVMFDAPADQKAQLADWVCLGMLYSGGECQLTVTLDVPVTMDNRFKNQIGYLDWEFYVEEFPVEDTDPTPPKTGDESHVQLWAGVMLGSLTLLILLGRKRKEN